MITVSSRIGNRIKELRNKAELSQEALSHSANINTSFLGQIERGLRNPTIEMLEKILNALDISFVDFFAFEPSIKTIKTDSALEKLILELTNRSDKELELLYNIAKQIISFEDEK